MDFWQTVADAIGSATGRPFTMCGQHAIGGGCINDAYLLEDSERRYFVKVNEAAGLSMFTAEHAGLEEIVRSRTIRAPRPLCHGNSADRAFLVMEYLEMGSGGHGSMVRLGHELAAMHRVSDPRYGWQRDNTIGSTPQINTPDEDWPRFWQQRRLGYQLQLAAGKGYGGKFQKSGERLLEAVPLFFSGRQPTPSLLHGDLWSGNYGVTDSGEPVIFDPAVYYGDREADLAMTELFGGFPAAFYDAYHEAWPLPPEYRVRKTLYNLYHILNHLNLFGAGYLGRAQAMMEQLLSEAGC